MHFKVVQVVSPIRITAGKLTQPSVQESKKRRYMSYDSAKADQKVGTLLNFCTVFHDVQDCEMESAPGVTKTHQITGFNPRS